MKITVERFASDGISTLGLLWVDGRCNWFTLEDGYRAVKVPGETRIPAGIYPIRLRQAGKVHTNYSAQFPGFHRGMLWLQDVPNFEWIYFHIGNTAKHTEGCILVGYGTDATPGAVALRSSTQAYRDFYEAVVGSAVRSDLEAEIIDRDRA